MEQAFEEIKNNYVLISLVNGVSLQGKVRELNENILIIDNDNKDIDVVFNPTSNVVCIKLIMSKIVNEPEEKTMYNRAVNIIDNKNYGSIFKSM